MNIDFSKSRKLISSLRLPAASNQGPVTNVPDTPRMRTFDLIKQQQVLSLTRTSPITNEILVGSARVNKIDSLHIVLKMINVSKEGLRKPAC